MKHKKYPIYHYEIEGVKDTEEHIAVLELIKGYIPHGFRHRYIEEYSLFLLATKEDLLKKGEEAGHELAKRLKEKGLELKVLKQ